MGSCSMLYLLMLANNMKVFHICFIPLCNLHGIMKYSELYKRQFQMVADQGLVSLSNVYCS